LVRVLEVKVRDLKTKGIHLKKTGILTLTFKPIATRPKWWNWKTRHLEGVVGDPRGGSNPPFGTIFLTK
jgi:hypothetical protein